MIIKVCKICAGDGFYRVEKAKMYPEMNIAGARPLRRPTPPTGDALLDYYQSIVGYEYDCRRCWGSGEVQWTRGKSLPPPLQRSSR